MLQAGLMRLAKLWPNASLNVLTEWPENLVHFCPEAVPISAVGRNLWVGDDILLGRFAKYVPYGLKHLASKAKRTAAWRFPATTKCLLTLGLRAKSHLATNNQIAEINAISEFSEAIAAADLVVACGAGGFYDGCREWNMATLDLIEAARQRDIPAAMFGQHFGPLTDAHVISRAKQVLPQVELITLRGGFATKAMLESLGVATSRIQVTGDEAVELAYAARPPCLGRDLAVNFRLRTSAHTSDSDIEMLRPILHEFARKHNVSLIPSPIAIDSLTSDYSAIKQLLQGFDETSDGGASLRSPAEIIRQIGRSRVLVTCAYHAAVFALAQGIPVVALAKSSYFVEKFLGLKERFGAGCEIVYLDHPDTSEKFRNVLETSWEIAEDVHVTLLQSAVRQIQLGWKAYNDIKELVTNRGRGTP